MKILSLLRVLSFGVAVFSCSAWAEQVVQNITVQGNERIDTSTVMSYVTLEPGKQYNQEQADQSIRHIYDSGLFSHATVRLTGATVIINVRENPMVGKIVFEGNKKIKRDVLERELTLKPRMVMTKARVREDVDRIIDIYRKSGRYGVHVEPKMVQLPENRVNIVFEITEGAKTPILKILFVGNKSFSDKALADAIQSHSFQWYRFLSSNDTYDADRLENDKMLLTKFYQSQGFADMSVQSMKSLLTPDRKGFYVTFVVDEGPAYNVSAVDVDCAIANIDTKKLSKQGLLVKVGEPYNIDNIDASIDAMTDLLGDQGYAFVNIDPQLERNPAANTIAITFKIEQAPKVYISKINIIGNTRTYDKVIRRELAIEEDDPFNYSKIRRSKEKIDELDYFKVVEVRPVPTPGSPDRVDLEVRVKEKATGSLSLSIGASSTEGLLANIGFNETNFMGRGQEIGASVGKSKYTTDLGFNFTQNHFFDTNIAAGFDVNHYDAKARSGQRYKERNNGLTVRGSYPLTHNLQHTVYYAISEANFKEASKDNPIQTPIKYALAEMMGKRVTSAVGQKLFYNRLNSVIMPSKGYYISVDQTVAGAGGDTKYVRHTGKVGAYVPFYKNKIVAQFTANIGHIQGYGGKNISLNDRFHLGGDEFRGFDFNGIGPRERTPNGPGEPLGGKTRYSVRAQLNLPTGLPEEYGFKWFPFVDAGSVFNPELSKGMTKQMIYSDKFMRVSAGLGVGWASPIGHITITYGKAFKKRRYDETDKLQFSFGSSL